MDLLLTYGADPNFKVFGLNNVLSYTIVANNLKFAKLLFAHGADLSTEYLGHPFYVMEQALDSRYYHILLYFCEHDLGTANWLKTMSPTAFEIVAMNFDSNYRTKVQIAKNYIL